MRTAEERWTDRLFDEAQGHFDECNCERCHSQHYLAENYGNSDFLCCQEAVDSLICAGKWCAVKPKEHADIYLDGGLCLACKN